MTYPSLYYTFFPKTGGEVKTQIDRSGDDNMYTTTADAVGVESAVKLV